MNMRYIVNFLGLALVAAGAWFLPKWVPWFDALKYEDLYKLHGGKFTICSNSENEGDTCGLVQHVDVGVDGKLKLITEYAWSYETNGQRAILFSPAPAKIDGRRLCADAVESFINVDTRLIIVDPNGNYGEPKELSPEARANMRQRIRDQPILPPTSQVCFALRSRTDKPNLYGQASFPSADFGRAFANEPVFVFPSNDARGRARLRVHEKRKDAPSS